MRAITIGIGILMAPIGLGRIGLHIQPAPFPALLPQSLPLQTTELPAGLPPPVQRFYRKVYGWRIPLIRTATVSGRGVLRLNGLTFPARFRFIHEAGFSYRHYIETTLFGIPVMKVNEYYVDGKERMELPFGIEEGPMLDQGGNLGMWAECAFWLPAALLGNKRVQWEPVDEVTAILVAPAAPGETATTERFVARFDPVTSRLKYLEVMRYKGSEGSKTLWLNEARAWDTLNGHDLPSVAALTWIDEGKAWAVFSVDEIAYNVDVDTSLTAKGP